jgi:integration host factor subunit alpha
MSNTFTKNELTELLFDQLGLNKREAKDVVESFFEEIVATLERGEEVKLTGFGTFHLLEKDARLGRNPKTGENATIAARRVVAFHPSLGLKESVEEHGNARQTPNTP